MNSNFLRQNRFYPSLLIWLVNVGLWVVISIIKGVDINEARKISAVFWIMFFSLYVFQAIPFFIFLKRNFENKLISNFILVVFMPILILLSIWSFFLFGAALTPTGEF